MSVKIYSQGNTLHVGGTTQVVDSGLTATISTETGFTDHIVVTDEYSQILVFAPYDDIYKADGTTAWGASTTAVRDALNTLFTSDNPNNYGDATDVSNNASEISAVKNRVTTAENDIADIEKAIQISTTGGGGRGLYYDNGKATTSSLLSVGDGSARMQAGSGTYIGLSEQSPGVQTFTVASGASGSETPYDAIVLSGKTTANTASFNLQEGTRLGFANGLYSVLLFPNTLTAARNITLPDASGTVALTSDIPNLLWTQSGNNIYYTNGNVGIGTSSPSEKLEVAGNILAVNLNLTGSLSGVDLNQLSDVAITSPADDHILQYNSTSGVWENVAPLWSDFTSFNFISTTYNVVTTGTLTVANLTLGNASQATTTIGVSASEDLDITSKGNVTVKLDSDNNETNQKFRINDPSTTERFSVTDTGVVSINSEYSLPNTDGTAGYALVTDGDGNVDWASVGISSADIGQMYKESSQTLTGTFTAITSWGGEDYDDLSILDTTNGTLTITAAGKYLIQADVHINLSSGTARSTSEMYLDLGGTEVSGTRRGFYNRTTGNGETSATISYLYKHVSGTATFKIMVAQTAGTDTLFVDTALFNYATLGGSQGVQGASGDAFDVGTETASRSLTAGDHLKYLRSTSSSAITFTVPPQSSVSWVDNAEIVFEQAGTGQITIAAGSGVTINSSETLKSGQQYAVIGLKRVASDVWTLTGEREAL